ncbi:hypothetical protein [Clostridium estertheticum]|nr:hypothetical protein [Clostridium estertheticum]
MGDYCGKLSNPIIIEKAGQVKMKKLNGNMKTLKEISTIVKTKR